MISYQKYCKKIELFNMTEMKKTLYTAYYIYNNSLDKTFTISQINEMLLNVGIHISNLSRISKQVGQSRDYKKINKDKYTLTSIAVSRLNNEISYFDDYETVEAEGFLLDLNIFCGYRSYLDKLILQANHCYENNCFDACATMMRRILETLLIDSYENLKIDNEIKDSNGNYYLLEKICKNAKNNTVLSLSRIRDNLDAFRDLENYASHRRYYNTFKSDIDNCKIKYRILIEELMYKSGIK